LKDIPANWAFILSALIPTVIVIVGIINNNRSFASIDSHFAAIENRLAKIEEILGQLRERVTRLEMQHH